MRRVPAIVPELLWPACEGEGTSAAASPMAASETTKVAAIRFSIPWVTPDGVRASLFVILLLFFFYFWRMCVLLYPCRSSLPTLLLIMPSPPCFE